MTLLRPIAAALALAAITSAATAQTFYHGFVTGTGYLAYSTPQKEAYLSGVWDGFMYSPVLGGNSTNATKLTKCVPGMTIGKLQGIVDQYLKTNPAKSSGSMNVILYAALPPACH